MSAYECLIKIDNAVKQCPAAINEISCNDIAELVYLDLRCREQLYPEKQMNDVVCFFDEMLSGIKNSIEKRNPTAFHREMEALLSYLKVIPDTLYSCDFIERANMDHLMLDHIRNRTVYAIGDSHVNFFSGNELLSFIPVGNDINTCKHIGNLPFSVFHMGPCLAYNSNRYGTTTRFKEKLDYLLQHVIEVESDLMFVMGEIDLRVHVFKQSVNNGSDYKEIVESVIANYIDMMRSVKEQGYNVFCFGPIASQSDETPIDNMFIRSGTEVERNSATQFFTERMKDICKDEGIVFMSVFDRMITDGLKTKPEYLCEDGCHLSQNAYSDVVDELKRSGIMPM